MESGDSLENELMLKMILDSHNVSAPNYGNQFHTNKIYSVRKGV